MSSHPASYSQFRGHKNPTRHRGLFDSTSSYLPRRPSPLGPGGFMAGRQTAWSGLGYRQASPCCPPEDTAGACGRPARGAAAASTPACHEANALCGQQQLPGRPAPMAPVAESAWSVLRWKPATSRACRDRQSRPTDHPESEIQRIPRIALWFRRTRQPRPER